MKRKSCAIRRLFGGGAFLLVLTLVGHVAAQTVTLISDDLSLTGLITTDGVSLFVGVAGTDIVSIPIEGGAATTLYTSATPCCIAGLVLIGTDLFWIDPNGDPDATAIFRGSTSADPITKIYSGFATGQPIVDGSDITADGVKLYTADFVQGRVHSLNPDGSSITQLGPNRYGGFFDREHRNLIDEDGGILYIADTGQPGFGDTPPRVQSIPVTGGTFTDLFVGPVFTNRGWGGIAVGNGTIFLTEGTEILQMPITGGTPTLLVTDPQFARLFQMIFFNDALYVTDGNAGKIFKVSFEIAPVIDIEVAPPALDFGSVDAFTSLDMIVTVANTGQLDLSVSEISLSGDPAYSATPLLSPLDLPIVLAPESSIDVTVTFFPTSEGPFLDGMLHVASDDPDESIILVSLLGNGLAGAVEDQATVLEDAVNTGITSGGLVGSGAGNSGSRRLNAFANMIEAAGDLIEAGFIDDACGQLRSALRRVDGDPRPPDFVTGSDAALIHDEIVFLRMSLGCE